MCDAGGDPHHGVAGFVYRCPSACAHARQDGGAVGRAFLGLDHCDFSAIHVRLNLAPKLGTSSTATQADRSRRNLHLIEDFYANDPLSSLTSLFFVPVDWFRVGRDMGIILRGTGNLLGRRFTLMFDGTSKCLLA